MQVTAQLFDQRQESRLRLERDLFKIHRRAFEAVAGQNSSSSERKVCRASGSLRNSPMLVIHCLLTGSKLLIRGKTSVSAFSVRRKGITRSSAGCTRPFST